MSPRRWISESRIVGAAHSSYHHTPPEGERGGERGRWREREKEREMERDVGRGRGRERKRERETASQRPQVLH